MTNKISVIRISNELFWHKLYFCLYSYMHFLWLANTSTNISWLTNVKKFCCVPLNHSFADACISENLYQSLFVCSSFLMKQVFRNCCTKHAQLWFLTGLHHCSFIFLSALSPNCLSKFWCIMLWACTAVLWTTLWAVPGGVCVVRWYDSWWRVRL